MKFWDLKSIYELTPQNSVSGPTSKSSKMLPFFQSLGTTDIIFVFHLLANHMRFWKIFKPNHQRKSFGRFLYHHLHPFCPKILTIWNSYSDVWLLFLTILTLLEKSIPLIYNSSVSILNFTTSWGTRTWNLSILQ